jgi:hypothetical protein
MEPFTLDRNFQKVDIIDEFGSIIWTERYYGDSEVQLTVPATQEMFQKLPVGTFLGLTGSSEIMILETMNQVLGNLSSTLDEQPIHQDLSGSRGSVLVHYGPAWMDLVGDHLLHVRSW